MTNVLVTGATAPSDDSSCEALRRHPALSINVGLRVGGKAPEGTRGVRLDWAAPATFAPAVGGVERLFLLTPFVEQFEGPGRAMLEAAAAAGMNFIVKLSATGLTEDVPFDSGRQHARLEQVLMGGSVPGALLKPTFFMDNVLTYQRRVILEHGAFYGASGGQGTTYVSRDVRAVGAAMLGDPSTFAGRFVARPRSPTRRSLGSSARSSGAKCASSTSRSSSTRARSNRRARPDGRRATGTWDRRSRAWARDRRS